MCLGGLRPGFFKTGFLWHFSSTWILVEYRFWRYDPRVSLKIESCETVTFVKEFILITQCVKIRLGYGEVDFQIGGFGGFRQRSPLSWCPSGTRTPASLQLVPASQQLRQKSQQNTSKGSENQFCMFNDVFFNQKFRKTSSVSIFLTSKQKNVKKLENFFFRFFSIFFSSKGPPLVN